MVLSNAERQRRYRQKRNALAQLVLSGQYGCTPLPAALACWISGIPGRDGATRDVDDDVAAVIDAIDAVLGPKIGALPDWFPDDSTAQPLLAVLGGVEYLREVREWATAHKAWEENPERDKCPEPVAPPIPV